MAYQMDWLVPNRVIYFKVEGDLALAELDTITKEIYARIEQSQETVSIIGNTTKLGDVPKNLPAIRTITQPLLQHPRFGLYYIVNGNAIVNFISTVITQIIGTRLTTVKTIDAALEHLYKNEPELRGHVVQSVLQ